MPIFLFTKISRRSKSLTTISELKLAFWQSRPMNNNMKSSIERVMHIGRYVIFAFRGQIQNWSATFFLKLHYRFILFFVSLFFRQSKTLSCYVICERSLWEKEKKKNEAEFVEEHKREY